ncbi:TetR/AcrR family transcriptional regulator C-terminal domain-containing protein [Actinoplanes sp. G11-F43]|uniref:TetR/AcrR family transcriptional regulator C-terminal domain-containing protein n=1 Tax=Actinoplanes sp. G11-F43 TaxID=3424130 RepID=UPI003D354B2B
MNAPAGRTGQFEVLWGERAQPRRGPKGALSLKVIAEAGITIADTENLTAISMQRVAAALGFSKMALYTYVPGKAELIALMADTALGPPPDPGSDAVGWRARLAAWARLLLPAFRRHPWILEATAGPRVTGPNELAWMEQALSALDGTDIPGAQRLDVIAVLAGHVRAIAQQGIAQSDPEAQLTTVIGEVLRRHPGRYPSIAAAVGAALADGPQDDAFQLGLTVILDGIDALLGRSEVVS